MSFKQFLKEQELLAVNEGKINDLINDAKEFMKRKGNRWLKQADKAFWWDGHVSPKEMKKKAKELSDEDLAKWVAYTLENGVNSQNSFQHRLFNRELKSRYGISPKGNLKNEL